jgi:hypothetical protein
MNSVKVSPGQTLADIVIEHYGYLDAVLLVAVANGLSVTDDLVAGSMLMLPPGVRSEAFAAQSFLVVPERFAEVAPGQTLADIAVQYAGDLGLIGALAGMNAVGLTALLPPGTRLKTPPLGDQKNKRVAAYFRQGGYCPATDAPIGILEGIDYWGIEFDFIVQ